MFAEFKHTLGRLRGQILGWGIGLGLYGLLMVSFFDTIQGMPEMTALLKSYPKEMIAFFGDLLAITTPQGYLDIYFFSYLAPIVGIFAAGACAGLVAGDEEKGILDLVLGHPVSRTALYWGRLLAFLLALGLILLFGYLSWVIPAGGTGMDLTWIEFLRPFLPLLAVLLLFGTLALLFSMVLPSARMAGMASAGLLVANWLLMGLANINNNLKTAVKYTPLYYYQGGKAVPGIDWTWLLGLLGAAVLFAGLAWWRFQRRDIRVGGEGGWRLSLRRRR